MSKGFKLLLGIFADLFTVLICMFFIYLFMIYNYKLFPIALLIYLGVVCYRYLIDKASPQVKIFYSDYKVYLSILGGMISILGTSFYVLFLFMNTISKTTVSIIEFINYII